MNENEATREHYDRVAFLKGPPVYSSSELYDAMFSMSRFERGGKYRILDAMCGSGLVGKEIAKRLENQDISYACFFTDLAGKQLSNLPPGSTVLGTVENLPFRKESFERVYARFGIKNYPHDRQSSIIREFQRALTSDGIFVVADMEAPEEAYDFMQAERLEKQKYTGRYIGQPHIPTRNMWLEMLKESGLTPIELRETISKVNTDDWVNSMQMTEENVRQMNQFLLSAPENARRALNIREKDGHVRVDYPVAVIASRIS